MLGRERRGSLIPSCEKPGTLGVRDPRCDPKSYVAQKKTHGHVYHWNMGVRDPRCDRKSYVAQNKTHGYHIDFELCDRSWD